MENTIVSSSVIADINLDMTEDELKHWGIQGMKWGVRRYQNADGSLTPAGRKRYANEVESLKAEKARLETRQKNLAAEKRRKARTDKLRAEIDELKGKNKPKKEKPTESLDKHVRKLRGKKEDTKPKKPEEMTLEELNDEINRMKAVQQYKSYYSQLNPPKVNKGKEVVDKFIDGALVPAAVNAAKDVGEKFMKKVASDALGLNEKEAKSALQKAQDIAAEAKAVYEAANYNAQTREINDKERQDAKRNAEIDKANAESAKNRADKADADNRYAKATDQDYQNAQRQMERSDTAAKTAKSEADRAESENKHTRAQYESNYLNRATTPGAIERMHARKTEEATEQAKSNRDKAKFEQQQYKDKELQESKRQGEIAKNDVNVARADELKAKAEEAARKVEEARRKELEEAGRVYWSNNSWDRNDDLPY